MVTEFERLVYEKTGEIPRGRVTTYGEIAKAIGKPKAARAVGSALNRNPHPITVPCHRVVGSNMHLGGYANGTDAKKQLLISEGIVIKGCQVIGEPFQF